MINVVTYCDPCGEAWHRLHLYLSLSLSSLSPCLPLPPKKTPEPHHNYKTKRLNSYTKRDNDLLSYFIPSHEADEKNLP